MRRSRINEVARIAPEEKSRRARVLFLENFLRDNPRHEFKKHIEQMYASLMPNEPNNTYNSIKKNMLEFYPGIGRFIKLIEDIYERQKTRGGKDGN